MPASVPATAPPPETAAAAPTTVAPAVPVPEAKAPEVNPAGAVAPTAPAPNTAVVASRDVAGEAATPAPAPKSSAEPAMQAPEKVAAAPGPATEAPPLSALMSEWQAARQAYAANKAEAVEAYRKLIAKHPQVVELRGELGNVYYALGQTKEAAEQYYEAALQHLKGPEPGLAACLAEVIKPIDAERAKVLEEKTAGHPCPYRRSR